MDKPPVHTQVEIRRPMRAGETIFLLGPGGVGKSTLGLVLAEHLHWPLIDLDLEFCARLAPIGDYIGEHGYQRYREENLALARSLVASAAPPSIFVTASGFLAAPPGTPDHTQSSRLVASGYRVVLLPSLDIDEATAIVVERQLGRGFGLRRDSETIKFQERFPVYRSAGDALVVSRAPPDEIAAALLEALGMPLRTDRVAKDQEENS